MEISEVRRNNLEWLLSAFNKKADFASLVDMNPSEVSQILSRKYERNIGNNLARKIERNLGLESGFMDVNRGNRNRMERAGLYSNQAISALKELFSEAENSIYKRSIADDITPINFKMIEGQLTAVPRPNTIEEQKPEAEYLGHIDAWDSKTPLDEDDAEVPFFMDVELAAGVGGELAQENPGFKLRFSRSTLKRCGVDPSNAACVKVSGNSMEPRLYDGDVVGVDTGNKRIVDGKTYAINHAGLLRVKRLYRTPGGGIRINSMNSAEHPDENYSAEERDDINIIGRVFWHSSIWD